MKWSFFISILFTVLGLGYYGDRLFELDYPDHFPKPEYQFKSNPLDSNIVQLGRALFYDPIFSKDNSISCASCHSPYNSFAHTDHDLSHGIGDSIGHRNAPALINLAWNKHFMWDGAIHNLDMQALAPIEHPKEMGSSFAEAIQRISASDLYKKLFFISYGDSIATGERALKALSQFQLTLVSAASKYDQVKLGRDQFSNQETKGYKLFRKHCNSCHSEPLFTNGEFANNGIGPDTTLYDVGRLAISKDLDDALKFKIPTLRNLEYTFPYMHDGRFRYLSEVLKHYTDVIEYSETLHADLVGGIKLSSNDQVDLLAFLMTLTDKEFVFNSQFHYPKELFLPDED